MGKIILPSTFSNVPIHLVGIKGSGMTALAEILQSMGAKISGSDTTEVFYTDDILNSLGIPYQEKFSAANLAGDLCCVIHSDAYSRETNAELLVAADRRIPLLSYAEALGELSRRSDFSGVSGVHGKTTTTALAGTILKHTELPVTVLAASQIPTFGNRSTFIRGSQYMVAEMDEYRRHFLHSSPSRIIITAVEPDHLDYFRDLDDIIDAFTAFGSSLVPGGSLIYCADDSGVNQVVARLCKLRTDIKLIPYGEGADGRYRISNIRTQQRKVWFDLAGVSGSFAVRLPGKHAAYNSTAALALAADVLTGMEGANPVDLESFKDALLSFRSPKRRCEVIGTTGGILFMDDYAHHPTAVKKTLEGIQAFYPGRRLIVDFMSHTYSRTKALLSEFASCFQSADVVVLHKIYGSAREADTGSISGKDLFREVFQRHKNALYFDEPMEAAEHLRSVLRRGDIFLTMGAGDNWKLGKSVLAALSADNDKAGALVCGA